MNEQITRALDAIEGAGATGSGDLVDMYRSIRPHLTELVQGLGAEGGNLERVGAVIENLLAGADAVASGAPDASAAGSGPTADANRI